MMKRRIPQRMQNRILLGGFLAFWAGLFAVAAVFTHTQWNECRAAGHGLLYCGAAVSH